jgi:uncharacterized DUF497 family protein
MCEDGMADMDSIFEWDKNKAKENIKKHGISFDEAKTVFNDPFLIGYPDLYYSEEERYILSENKILELSVVEKQLTMKGKIMKKDISNQTEDTDNDMLPEYDFKNMPGGVRGRFYRDLSKGYTVIIHNKDGTTKTRHVKPKDNAVILDPDVRKYFPDSEAVNNALRCLIPLLAEKRKKN